MLGWKQTPWKQTATSPDVIEPFLKLTDTGVAFPHFEDTRGKILPPLAGFFPETLAEEPLFIDDMLDTSPRVPPFPLTKNNPPLNHSSSPHLHRIPEEKPAEHPTITQEVQVPLQMDTPELLLTYVRRESP